MLRVQNCLVVVMVMLWSAQTSWAGVSRQTILDPTTGRYLAAEIADAASADNQYLFKIPVLGGLIEDRSPVADSLTDPVVVVDSLSLYSQDSATPLSWEEAHAIIFGSIVRSPRFVDAFPASEYEDIDLGNNSGIFKMPKVFDNFVFSNQLNSFSERSLLYERVFLDLFSREDWSSDSSAALIENIDSNAIDAIYLSYLFSRTSHSAYMASIYLSGDNVSTVAEKVFQRTDELRKHFKFFGYLVTVASALSEERNRQQSLRLAFALEGRRQQAEDVVRLLQQRAADGGDSAMTQGAINALRKWEEVSTERFVQTVNYIKVAGKAVGGGAAKTLIEEGIKVAKAKIPLFKAAGTGVAAAGAGLVLGLVEVGKESWDTSQVGIYIGALLTISDALVIYGDNINHRYYNDQNISLAGIVDFQHYTAWLAHKQLNDEILRNRNIAKIFPYWIKKLKYRGLKSSLQQGEMSIEQLVRENEIFNAALPRLMAEVEAIYIGPKNDPTQTIIAIVDCSGSMRATDPRNLRRSALDMMIESMGPEVALGIVSFESGAQVLAAPTVLGGYGSAARESLLRASRRIYNGGQTNIRSGLDAAASLVGDSASSTCILLTDGQDGQGWSGEPGNLPAEVVVHTIALSDEADRTGLAKLGAATGGVSEVAHTHADLQRIFGNLFARTVGDELLALEEGIIATGDIFRSGVNVEPGQGVLKGQVSWPGSNVDLALVSPSGRRHDIRDAVRGGYGVERDTYDIIRIENPEPGLWEAVITGVQLAAGGEPFTFQAVAREPALRTSWALNIPVPEVGEVAVLNLDTQGLAVQWREAESWLIGPDNVEVHEVLSMGGVEALLSGANDRRVWSMRMTAPGVYRLKARVVGTADGTEVARMYDTTFRVAERGSGVKRTKEIDPFIRRVQ